MTDGPDEELAQPGRSRRALPLAVVLLVVLAAAAAVVVATRHDAPRASRSTPSPTLSIPADPTSVPEQDAVTALNRCGGDCDTYSLTKTVLRRTGLRGLVASFGLRVTAGRREQLRSIIGHAGATQVRLLYERVALADAGLRVTDSRGPGRTVVLAVIRRGWRLTAVLVGARPPIPAAIAWARSAPLPA